MSWTWRLQDHTGATVPGPDVPRFDSQSDAESWLGETWSDLLDDGISAVTLLDGDRVEYADMSLHPPE